MACGTPVLGTAVGGTKEILSGFDPRFLFRDTSPGAMTERIAWAMRRFFSPEGVYDDLRLRCRQYASKRYSWERHVDQLKSILEGMF
jgi:glycosyltransferase involved in cell wall biosynthesis